jgi:hypothetical protein
MKTTKPLGWRAFVTPSIGFFGARLPTRAGNIKPLNNSFHYLASLNLSNEL